MREAIGNLWDYPAIAKVVTTNGDVNSRGEAVMGRGVALQCKQRYPGMEMVYGRWLAYNTLEVTYMLASDDAFLIFFPVKIHWREKASISLILRSLGQLIDLADKEGWNEIALPRPGCGNGGLDWKIVKPLLESVLDDRFVVVNLR